MPKSRGERDSVHVEGKTNEVESNDIYIGKVFGDKEEAYDIYNLYLLVKEFGIRKSKIRKCKPCIKYYEDILPITKRLTKSVAKVRGTRCDAFMRYQL